MSNEDEFLSDLMTQWESKQNQISDTEQKELASAKRRFRELNDLIQSLYESKVKDDSEIDKCRVLKYFGRFPAKHMKEINRLIKISMEYHSHPRGQMLTG